LAPDASRTALILFWYRRAAGALRSEPAKHDQQVAELPHHKQWNPECLARQQEEALLESPHEKQANANERDQENQQMCHPRPPRQLQKHNQQQIGDRE
jgi:hypothetical protein